jgi:hypothetical protein
MLAPYLQIRGGSRIITGLFGDAAAPSAGDTLGFTSLPIAV